VAASIAEEGVLEPGIVAKMRLAKVGRALEAAVAETRIALKLRL
jgi:hypothetical protein